jgi:hypothetical protein
MRTVVLLSILVVGAAFTRADNEDSFILEKLSERTMIDFTDVPVDDGLEYLSDYHALAIEFDAKALKKAGINPNAVTSTLKLKNAPLGLALRAILEPGKLSFMIKNHVLTVTTFDEAKAWQKKHFGDAK